MRALTPLILMLTLTLAACADSSSDSEPPKTNPLDGCAREVVEPDLELSPLQGPAVDPQTQQLNLPPGAIVATTYLALQGGDTAQQRFMEVLGPVQQDLGARQGLLAIATTGSAACGTARTLTVWESEAAMMDFVTGEAHLAAMQAVGDLSRGSSVTMAWSHDGGAVSWPAAIARLKEHDGPVY